jgi:predicted RecA/RadA family phage recombinase
MAENLRTEGKALAVTLTSAKTKGDYALLQGFFGIIMQDGVSGQEVALDISQRVFEIPIGGLTGAKGQIIYVDGSGVLTNTEGSNKPAFKVVKAKNTSNYIFGLLLPQE